MKLHSIHQSPQEKLASHSEESLALISENSKKVSEAKEAISDLLIVTQLQAGQITGLSKHLKESIDSIASLSQNISLLTRKLEEIKSASLITNQYLKKLENKEPPPFPEIPRTDLEKTNVLLKKVVDELAKPVDVKLDLKLK